jgi:hypothetical protein
VVTLTGDGVSLTASLRRARKAVLRVAVAAEAAIRAWVTARTDLVGPGNPLEMGAFLWEQASPDHGAYAVLSRNSEGVTAVVAEPAPTLGMARIQAIVYAGTQESAEFAAKSLRAAWESLAGYPERCGTTGITVLVSDNLVGPLYLGNTTPEQYAFQVNADFLLRDDTGG